MGDPSDRRGKGQVTEMKTLFDLEGKCALVTGASQGIGRAIAIRLAQHGARVIVSSRSEEACEKVASEIRANGGEASAVACDITRKEDLEQVVSTSRNTYGRVDILVCNAAVNLHMGSQMEITGAQLEKTFRYNVQSNFDLIRMVIPDMQAMQDGCIVIISALGGKLGIRDISAYSMSKAAELQMARNLAVEFGVDNIRANAIAPGLVKTDFARALWEDPDWSRRQIDATPLRRLGEPDDIAGAVVFLASDAGKWMTGQTLVIDGGVEILHP